MGKEEPLDIQKKKAEHSLSTLGCLDPNDSEDKQIIVFTLIKILQPYVHKMCFIHYAEWCKWEYFIYDWIVIMLHYCW